MNVKDGCCLSESNLKVCYLKNAYLSVSYLDELKKSESYYLNVSKNLHLVCVSAVHVFEAHESTDDEFVAYESAVHVYLDESVACAFEVRELTDESVVYV